MNKKTIYLAFGAITLIFACWGINNYQQDPDRLFARFAQQMKEERFEEIYDESDDLVKKNVDKKEFARRMRDAVGKLKEIDPNLNFQKDSFLESLINSNYLGMSTAIGKLENEKHSVSLTVRWRTRNFFPRFEDMRIMARKDSSQFEVHAITHKNISYEEKGGKKTINYHY